MHSLLTTDGVKRKSNRSVEPKRSSTELRALTRGATALAMLTLLFMAAIQSAHAQTETVLYSFAGRADPYYVTPVLDKNGNLYGTTWQGGIMATATCLSSRHQEPRRLYIASICKARMGSIHLQV